MKAIRIHAFGGPDVLKMESIPDPKPQTGQVLVKLHAIGVNPVDTYIRSGIYGDRSFPFTPGADGAGIVEAAGPGVEEWKPGDRVYLQGGNGSYAEKTIADLSQVHPLPEKISFQQGAALGIPYTTAYYALFFRALALPNEWVFVHGGTGGVGTAAIQFARARGLKVIASGGTDKGRALAKEQGAHHVLDHGAADYLDQAVKLTGGHGLDLILEMRADLNLGKDLKVLAPRGRVVVIGNRGKVEIDPRDTMGRNADIRGMSIMTAKSDELAAAQSAIVAGLEIGTLHPVIGREFPLAEAAKAHQAVLEPGSYGKIILTP